MKTWTIEATLQKLNELQPNTQPKWGGMSAQRMVEHLTDTLLIASGKKTMTLLVPEEKLPKMQAYLESDKPMARNIEVPFAKAETPLRNEDMAAAIDEFTEEWVAFQEAHEAEGFKTVHPYYGALYLRQWELLHEKHIQHHFTQFGLVAD